MKNNRRNEHAETKTACKENNCRKIMETDYEKSQITLLGILRGHKLVYKQASCKICGIPLTTHNVRMDRPSMCDSRKCFGKWLKKRGETYVE